MVGGLGIGMEAVYDHSFAGDRARETTKMIQTNGCQDLLSCYSSKKQY